VGALAHQVDARVLHRELGAEVAVDHSTVASASARARLVTRLNTLFDQFWTVV